MNWLDILKIGFSGFAFAILFYSYKLHVRGKFQRSFAWIAVTLATLVILSSSIEILIPSLISSKEPRTILAPCLTSLELLRTQSEVVSPEQLKEVMLTKITICEELLDELNIR